MTAAISRPSSRGHHPSRPTIALVVGARPNFMKAAPLYRSLRAHDWCHVLLVHTGQHYDREMSEVFLEDLGLPTPHERLCVGGGSHAQQTAAVMTSFEDVCLRKGPSWVVVVGDVNSTIGAALTAAKLQIPVAHLEAGLRSFDRTMPEELNRVVTDTLATLLWTPSEDADQNLCREGIPTHRIVRIGNCMIDTLETMRPRIAQDSTVRELGLRPSRFVATTLHRPSNVEDPERLRAIIRQLAEASRDLPVVLPLHPRTRQRLRDGGLVLSDLSPQLRALPPLGYVQFLALVQASALVVTDSGGLQEETTHLGVPCLTVRENTERPITVTSGTNRLVAPWNLAERIRQVAFAPRPDRPRIPLWDGHAAERAAKSLRDLCRFADPPTAREASSGRPAPAQ